MELSINKQKKYQTTLASHSQFIHSTGTYHISLACKICKKNPYQKAPEKLQARAQKMWLLNLIQASSLQPAPFSLTMNKTKLFQPALSNNVHNYLFNNNHSYNVTAENKYNGLLSALYVPRASMLPPCSSWSILMPRLSGSFLLPTKTPPLPRWRFMACLCLDSYRYFWK